MIVKMIVDWNKVKTTQDIIGLVHALHGGIVVSGDNNDPSIKAIAHLLVDPPPIIPVIKLPGVGNN